MTLVEEEHFLALDPKPWVSLGVPFAEACAHHASLTFRAKRVYLIISSSISKTPALRSLKAALGDNIVGIRYRIRQHVPWPDVLEVAVELRDLDADLIVTLGAGSLTDAAKVASFAVVKGAFSLDALDKIHIRNADPSKLKPCTIPIINIPTSLSGGEYNPPGGATDLRNSRKTSFNHGSMGAQLVILDPELTVSTPERVWLSSGMRAVDHCIEGLCSVAFRDGDTAGSGKVDRHLLKGLRLLLRSLLTTKHNPGDLEARKREMGVIEAMRGLTRGVPMGASHGIGHQLGPLGVGHGETSCVMLPSVLRWNLKNQGEGEKWVRERLLKVLDAFWEDATKLGGLSREALSAGDVVAAFFGELELPGSLTEDKLEALAKNSMTDRCIPTNPVAITEEAQILEILEMALTAG
ncbi:iron-containing alcohol dehydrogenase [Podospora fimiseda]|uniref:Iron-containing alcohol dehydrogenase n=1 Tax=Podospora fimiseda TaxID=252190 RepID=A0AAN7BG21_9PEZI|nr:iron-containing alcohol dehydrogenase [Podospora fimiseda]